ncbi:MAG: hypothetical protein QF733_03775 [Phycisphaerales bacterium]|jgi:hypothetical protein|nr:hypothetical protein [Phycisphaerales bacterium]
MSASPYISTIQESEEPRGWCFHCGLAGGGEATIRLDWADYDHWCPGGGSPPERVAEVVIRIMMEHGVTVPERFDAARVRHVVRNADELVTALLGS